MFKSSVNIICPENYKWHPILKSDDQKIRLKKKYIIHPMTALKGIVRIQAQKIFVVTPHLTAVAPFLAPTPIIAPVIV